MCTIIRVKRKITEDPVDCLIIECKKNKLIKSDLNSSIPNEQNDEIKSQSLINNDTNVNIKEKSKDQESITQILKYAGSAKNESEIQEKINEFNLKSERPTRTKRTKQTKQANGTPATPNPESKTFNYVLLNKKRGLDTTDETNSQEINGEPEAKKKSSKDSGKKLKTLNFDEVNIIDVISKEYFDESEASDVSKNLDKNKKATNDSPSRITCNGVELIREKVTPKKESQYVYDIYYTKNTDIHLDLLYTNNYEIKSCNNNDHQELVDDCDSDEEIRNEEDEDSNDEGNWRNDYPDEDEDYDDDDIDNENDDDDRYYSRNRRPNYQDDDYDEFDDEYGYGKLNEFI